MTQQHWTIAKTPAREAAVAEAIERLGVKSITGLVDWATKQAQAPSPTPAPAPNEA